MKKFLAVLLALVITFSVFAVVPFVANAEITLDEDKAYVFIDGEYYEVECGQTFTYAYYLRYDDARIVSLDARTYYDTTGLDFVPTLDEDGYYDIAAMFPVMGGNTVYNFAKDGTVYYNFSSTTGKKFNTDESIVFVGDFLVTAQSGIYEIRTEMITLANYDLKALYYNGEKLAEYDEKQIIADIDPVDETTESTEVTEPTDPTDDTESTEPTDDTESTEPTDDTETTEPTDDTEPTEPTDDTEPTESTDPTEPALLYGDVNQDSLVNVFDVTAIQRYSAKFIQLSEVQFKQADVNFDGEVNIIDATAIQRYAAGIIKEFLPE